MNKKLIIFTSLTFLLFVGCGGSSGSSKGTNDSDIPSSEKPNQSNKNESKSPFGNIKILNDKETLNVGTYSNHGVKFYNLIMPKKGNVVIDALNTIGADLYDENLNLIEDVFVATPTMLDAGTYVLKVTFYDNSDSTITVNSDALYNQNNLPSILSGTTTSNGIKYYKLAMPKKGNIIIDALNTIGANLYDIKLNLIEDNFTSNPITLNAGTYVLKVKFYNKSNSSITLNF